MSKISLNILQSQKGCYMMSKIKHFLQDKGYLVVVLICIAAVVAACISLAKLSPDEDDTVLLSSPTNKPYTTANSGISATATPSPTAGNQDVSKPITPKPTNTPEAGLTKLIKPTQGEIQTGFALKKLVFNSTLKEWRTHSGVDLAGKKGDYVKAAASGVVASIKIDPRYGLTVIISHVDDGSIQTVYCGLDTTSVSVGDRVDAGDNIGNLGGEIFCERDQGVHLHFELINKGQYSDPSLLW